MASRWLGEVAPPVDVAQTLLGGELLDRTLCDTAVDDADEPLLRKRGATASRMCGMIEILGANGADGAPHANAPTGRVAAVGGCGSIAQVAHLRAASSVMSRNARWASA